MEKPYRTFCCYARRDQKFLHNLKNHLMSLERQGWITVQADIDISPGTEWEQAIDHHLDVADIILLLISPAFIASEYCFNKEMRQAVARHEQGTACVIPVIIRPTHSWETMPFGKLQALPIGAEPVSLWKNRDNAYLSITEGIRTIAQELTNTPINPKSGEHILQNAAHLQTIQEALLDGDYDVADEGIKSLPSKMPIQEQAKLKYLEALTRLKGKRPRIQARPVITKVEKLLSEASEYHHLYSYTQILAIIEDDFADFNSFSWMKEKANNLMHQALNIAPVAEDRPNIELLSRVQPDLFKEYRSYFRV